MIESSQPCSFPSNIYVAFFRAFRIFFASWMKGAYGRTFGRLRVYIPVRCVDELIFFVNPFDWGHDLVLREVVGRKVYERFFAPELGDNVVDAGAHIGTFTIRSARLVGPTGIVVAFEPNPQSFDLLKKNIALNQIKNILVVNSALGSNVGSGYLLVPTLESEDTQVIGDYSMNSKLVDIISLDVYCEHRVPRVDFLKIDVEGSELRVLKGAVRTITKNRMRIVMEVHNRELLREVKHYLETKEYKMLLIKGSFSGLSYLYASNRADDLLRAQSYA